MKIRKKLNFFVIFSSFLASLIVIGMTFVMGSNFLTQRTQQAFQIETYFTLRELDRLFFERSADVEVLSRSLNPLTESWGFARLEDVLFLFRDYTKSYQNIAYVDENFIKRLDTNRTALGQKVNWPGLIKAKGQNKVVFDFYEDVETKTLVVSFVKQLISPAGVKSGYIVCNVPFSTISRITRLSRENTLFKVKNRVELVREDGEIVYSTYREDKFDHELAARVKDVLPLSSYFHFEQSNGKLWSFGKGHGFYTLETLNWYLVMSTREIDVYEPLKGTILVLILLLSIGGFIFWFLISNITKTLVRPLENASVAVEKFGHGELKALEHIQAPEDEVGFLIRNLRKMGNQIQELMTQRAQKARMTVLGEIAGNIAHEINNPLQVISIRLELIQKNLQQEIDVEKIKSNIDIASQTVFRISKIVKGLKALSREGDADPFSPVSVQELIDNVLVLCQGTLRNSLVKIEAVSDQPLFKVECRAVQITQVLLNLINNSHDAVKGLDQNQRWIQLSCELKGPDVEFRVRNSGPKILFDQTEKIFDPFYTTKKAGEGTGLGLSISLKIAKEHLGSLFVDMTDPHTCFVLKIAVKSPDYKNHVLT